MVAQNNLQILLESQLIIKHNINAQQTKLDGNEVEQKFSFCCCSSCCFGWYCWHW
jgi:hypothetical protein